MPGIVLLLIRTALAAALYAFLGWMLLTLWRKFRQDAQTLEAHTPPEIRLRGVFGEGEAPQTRRFRAETVILGRDFNCQCILPSETVSARHARLSFHHGQWWLEDLNSTNGTFLNGERVTTGVVVTFGDEIRCGALRLSIPEEEEER